jgi:hypothetical protein
VFGRLLGLVIILAAIVSMIIEIRAGVIT